MIWDQMLNLSADDKVVILTCQKWQKQQCFYRCNILFTLSRSVGFFKYICSSSLGWLALVDQGQTINLYKLTDVLKSCESGLVTQPWHTFFSQHPITTLSFLEDNVLAGSSSSVKSISLWVGIDNIGSSRVESSWLLWSSVTVLECILSVKFGW